MDSSSKEKLVIALCLLDLGLEAYINNLIEIDFKSISEELSDSVVGAATRLLDQYKKASIYDKPVILNQLRATIVPRIKTSLKSYQSILEQKNSDISSAFPEIFDLMYGEGLENAKNFEENLLFGKNLSDWFDSTSSNLAGSVITSVTESDGSLSGVEESFSKALPTIAFISDGLIRQTANNTELGFYLGNEEAFPELQFVAVMDSRTSAICRSLNGKTFGIDSKNIPTPPLHPNCRSRLVPVVSGGIDFPSFNEFLGMLSNQGKTDIIKSILGSGGYELYSKDKFTSLNYFTTQKFESTDEIINLIKEGME